MSVSPLTSILLNHTSDSPPGHQHQSRRTYSSSMGKMSGFLGFGRKGSKRGSDSHSSTSDSKSQRSVLGRLTPPVNNNSFTSSSPATRRPDRPGMSAFSTPANEPPPAYTPSPIGQPAIQPFAQSDVSGPPENDDQYAFLKSFDTIFLIDDSGSMAGRSWRETGKALEMITPICTQRDADGIDIHFLNRRDRSYENVTSAGTVVEAFQTVRPSGATPTGQRLQNILKSYLQKYARDPDHTKPINIIVITDGEPSDDVESPIVATAKKLDQMDAPAWQVGIQFFQVGNEPRAREALKALDDDLASQQGIRDLVDTVPFTGAQGEELSAAGIMKVVLGSVNRRLDRNSTELHQRRR